MFRFFVSCLCFFYLWFASFSSVAQPTQTQFFGGYTIAWQPQTFNAPTPTNPDLQVPSLTFKDAEFNFLQHPLPYWSNRLPLNATTAQQVSVSLVNMRFEPAGFSYNAPFNALISTDIAPTAAVATEKKRPFAVVTFIPLRYHPITGELEKLISFDLEVKIGSGLPSQNTLLQAKSNRSYTTNSVLNSGAFYSFKTDKTGMHKIDYAFLQSLGITSLGAMSDLRIYGNGGGMLPELAGADKFDDLVENPILVFDQNGNNVFDPADYVVFYAESADKWLPLPSQGRFTFQKHLYSTHNFYFLTFDKGAGKRISAAPQNTAYNTEVTAFTDYAVHQTERIQILKSGRNWLGEEFNVELSQNFNFGFPHLIPEQPLTLRTQVAARYITGNSAGVNSIFRVSANGTLVQTIGVSSVTGSYEGFFANMGSATTQFTASSPNLTINLTYSKPTSGAIGWLDFIELNARRQLTFDGGQVIFSDPLSVGTNKLARFVLQSNATNPTVWDITTPTETAQYQLTPQNAGQFIFYASANTLRRYIVFDGTQFHIPTAVGSLPNQNLHTPEIIDFIIIAHPDFLPAAQRLADYRQTNNNLRVKVVTPQEIYNEFSSGTPDISAIRDYVKMFYDRAEGNANLMPKYLLLFGDASYDFKSIEFKVGNNHNFVPTYQSVESLNSLDSYCTDDYFGLLDDNEGQNLSQSTQLLDIAIGRIPVKTPTEAQQVVDKILNYHSSATIGDWRNNITLVADDEDGGLHYFDAEIHAEALQANNPIFNLDKIYIDTYPQISTAGGNLYPEVNMAINNKIFSGTFIMNYVGHGGEAGWAHERILKIDDIRSWRNINHLPLFITATCSFSRYDNPEKESAGELLMIKPDGGAIALMTTVRLVFASANQRLNTVFINRLFQKDAAGNPLALGEIARLAKNDANALTSASNNRKFVLLGDPSMVLAYPQHKAIITSINNQPMPQSAIADTIKALSQVTMTGQITNEAGNKLTNFSGTVYPIIFDKPASVITRKNDTGSRIDTFQLRRNIIFRGKASVTNGEFTFSFITPKDIAYQFGAGRISLYADNGLDTDAHGFNQQIIVGGVADDATQDNSGPDVKLYLNDEKFVFGGTTNTNPILIAKLSDASGINTVGNGIGRNLTAVLNDDNKNSIALNQYYKAALDDFTKGEARYLLNNLPDGLHTLNVNAWDTHNNLGKGYTEFIVASDANIALSHVLNYPNPFTDNTAFWFEHNRPNDQLLVTIQIMTISGRVVKTIQQPIVSEGFRVDNLTWDGRDDFGNRIGRGTYIYKLTVRSLSDNKVAHQIQKLVLLK
ncbi:MAG TPA: type IX secretion system sortase PorU [Chitinophagales bacterium]|mgnify:CR=1 FL=1|nr:type IX secretion system sortase PorU [Chitinophagales bacterium]